MESSQNTILVTGGCGFLGSHLVDTLVADGDFQIVAVSRNPVRYCNPKATYMVCDVTQHTETAALIERIKPIAIIHTVTPGPFALAHLHQEDHAATTNLVSIAARSTFVTGFIYTGSAEAMKNVSGRCENPLTEANAILHTSSTATSAYAQAKSASESFVLQAHDETLSCAVLRLPGMFGPRENQKTGIAVSFIRLANTLATYIQLGDNKVLHDWIYVENAAYGHVLALKSLLNDPKSKQGEAFFITDGTPMRLWDFVRRLWTTAGDENCNQTRKLIIPWWIVLALAATTELIFRIFTLGRLSPSLTRLHVHFMKEGAWFDITKAQNRLGYSPLISTDEGIQRTVDWFKRTSLDSPAGKTE